MALRADPRRDLPVPNIESLLYPKADSWHPSYGRRRAASFDIPARKPKKKPCYDWMFCTASNVHVVIDKASFKTYRPFKSYVLTMSDQRQVPVRGIGTCEIKIRREPGRKETHTVLLENVLYVPEWLCNIISSDVCFTPAKDYEHTENEFGFTFIHRDGDEWGPWGYTENFCSLDRLVLSRVHHGRSPMLEDREREVFSISLTWPQSQRDKWEKAAATVLKRVSTNMGPGKADEQVTKRGSEEEAKKLVQETRSQLIEKREWKTTSSILTAAARNSSTGLVERVASSDTLRRVSNPNFDGKKT